MFRALTTAATGMEAQQTRIDTTAHNMANVNTTGFKRARAEFQDLLYDTQRNPGGQNGNGATLPVGIQIGQGTRLVGTMQMHQQGSLAQTGNPMDLAIEGRGFFQVTQPNGETTFTRAGNLKVDDQGQLVTVDGLPLEPLITIPPDAASVTVTADGIVSVTVAGDTQSQEVGQLLLATFPNPAGLEAIGRSQFRPTTASGIALVGPPGQDGTGTLSQGFLEGSNVEVVNEMIDLITSQRAYEVNQKVIEASDEMLQRTTR
ncbi:MAG: flagellar basal-body rod protein FlgG [Myxococcota bacterium]